MLVLMVMMLMAFLMLMMFVFMLIVVMVVMLVIMVMAAAIIIGEFYNNQVESANTIILSRTQGMKEEKLAQAVSMIQEKNAKAKIITTPWDELTGEQILWQHTLCS